MKELRQKRIQSFAFVIGVFLAFCLCCFFIPESSGFASDNKSIRLNSQINPNNASTASLARLPGIGVSKAEAIVEYRLNYIEIHENNQAFKSCDDLQNVKGIGPRTAQEIKEWLEFE